VPSHLPSCPGLPALPSFVFELVGTEAAINAKKELRDPPEGAADLPRLIPQIHSVFLRLPPRTP